MAFAHLALPTRDLRRTARFFEVTLGWLPIERPENIAVPAAWLAIGEGQEVHLLEVADFTPSPFEREYGRHLAVTYPREGFEALRDRLRAEGAEVITAERPTSFARFFFRSPDGYMIEVVEEKLKWRRREGCEFKQHSLVRGEWEHLLRVRAARGWNGDHRRRLAIIGRRGQRNRSEGHPRYLDLPEMFISR